MSIFGNMMGAYQMGSDIMGDSFSGGMGEVESALIEQNIPLQSSAPASELQQSLGAIGPGATGPGAPQQSQVDETQMVGPGAGMAPGPGDIMGKLGGAMDNNIGRTLTGDNIAGGIAKLFTGGLF